MENIKLIDDKVHWINALGNFCLIGFVDYTNHPLLPLFYIPIIQPVYGQMFLK